MSVIFVLVIVVGFSSIELSPGRSSVAQISEIGLKDSAHALPKNSTAEDASLPSSEPNRKEHGNELNKTSARTQPDIDTSKQKDVTNPTPGITSAEA